MVDVFVERIFFFKKHLVVGMVLGDIAVDCAHVTTGTKRFVAAALNHHGLDGIASCPFVERGLQGADHGEVQGVQGLGPIQGDEAHRMAHLNEELGFGDAQGEFRLTHAALK